MDNRISKNPAESFVVGNDFTKIPLAAGETLVLSGLVNGISTNSSAVAYDKNGTDVSGTILVAGTVALAANDAGVADMVLQVKVKAGTVADKQYKVSLRAVTSAGNLYEADVYLVMQD